MAALRAVDESVSQPAAPSLLTYDIERNRFECLLDGTQLYLLSTSVEFSLFNLYPWLMFIITGRVQTRLARDSYNVLPVVVTANPATTASSSISGVVPTGGVVSETDYIPAQYYSPLEDPLQPRLFLLQHSDDSQTEPSGYVKHMLV